MGFAGLGVGKRAFSHGMTWELSLCFTVCAEEDDSDDLSMKDVNFAKTVSNAGTCVNRIGSVETESRAGIDFCVCGCAWWLSEF